MFNTLKIDDYLKILSDDEMKDFVAIYFSEYFKYVREKLYSKLSEEQNLRKFFESPYIILTTPDKVEKHIETMQSNSSDNWYIPIMLRFWIFLIQNYNYLTLKLCLKQIKRIVKFKVQTVLSLVHNKRMIVKSSILVLN